MNTKKEPYEGSKRYFPDHRITFLLCLAIVLLCSKGVQIFVSTLHIDSKPVPQLAISSLGLTLKIQSSKNDGGLISIDNHFRPFFFKPIQINFASIDMLTTIPGVGNVLATAIVAQRKQTGLITSPEDLLQIRGIGLKRMDWLSKHVSFD